MKNYVWVVLSIAFLYLTACQKESIEPIDSSIKNTISLEFENRVGSQSLIMANQTYQNAQGESFSVTKLNYFISNVSLKNVGGQVINLNDQYFLLRAEQKNTLVPIIKDVPSGDYTEISFTIGVDSVKSISPVEQRVGVLDPASYGDDNMYWSWNSGYIFFKMEGISSAAPLNTAGEQKFQYHVGGFGGRTAATANNLQRVALVLPNVIQVRKSIAPTIHLVADISKVFNGIKSIRIADGAVIMNPAGALPISANYVKMFSVDHVHN